MSSDWDEEESDELATDFDAPDHADTGVAKEVASLARARWLASGVTVCIYAILRYLNKPIGSTTWIILGILFVGPWFIAVHVRFAALKSREKNVRLQHLATKLQKLKNEVKPR